MDYLLLFEQATQTQDNFVSSYKDYIVIILSATAALVSWNYQKRKELKIEAFKQKEAAIQEACKAVWSLLSYMSQKENTKTVFVKRGTAENTIDCLRINQAFEFLYEFEQVYYHRGHGLFMTKKIQDNMYAFRIHIYRLLNKEGLLNQDTNIKPDNKIGKDNLVKINKRELVLSVNKLFEDTMSELRHLATIDSTKDIYRAPSSFVHKE